MQKHAINAIFLYENMRMMRHGLTDRTLLHDKKKITSVLHSASVRTNTDMNFFDLRYEFNFDILKARL